MSTLRIKDAPLLPNVDGSEKIPTGGKGDYSVTLDQVKTFTRGSLPQQLEDHINDISNPHQVTKDQVGLGNADNTSDVDKPVSTSTQEALDLKANTTDVDNALNLKANIEDVNSALNLKADKTYVDTQDSLKLDKSEKGVSGGLATLDDSGKVPRTELPSFVDLDSNVPTYKTVTDGVDPVIGVADGGYFNVRSEDNDTVAVEYQNVGGSPVSTGKSCPNGSYVETIAEYTALPFKQGKTYGLNERVQLDSGDIVKSTIAENTANPNFDMTGWVKTNDAGQIFDASGNSQQLVNDQIKTPILVNADDTGATDATAALNLLMNPSGKNVIQMTKGVYLTDGIVIPPNSIVYFNGSTVKRRRYTGKPVIDVPPSSVIVSVVEDGNKDTLGSTGGAIGDSGIRLQEGAIAIFCTQKNNYSHGLTLRGTSTLAPTSNQQALYCVSVNNGFNAGAFGTADGFNALNCNNGAFIGCRSYGSARSAFVSETYNGNIAGEDKHDVTFSNGFKFKECFAEGSGYNDFNAEMTTNPIFDDIRGEQVTFRGSLRTQITKANVGQIYGQDADYTQISESNLVTTTRSNDVLYLTGKSPKVTNVTVLVGDSATLTGTAVTVHDLTGYNGEVIGLSVNRAFNGMNLRVANAVALRVDSATNVKYFIGRAEGSVNVTNFKQLTDKKLEVFSSAVPTQGSWNKNDIVWNTFFSATSKTMAWVCTSSGVFGSTPPVFEAITIMSRASAVPNAVGANPTKAEFDALLTALRNSGQLSS